MSQTPKQRQTELTQIFCTTNNMLATVIMRTHAAVMTKLGNSDTQRDMVEAKALLEAAIKLYSDIINRERPESQPLTDNDGWPLTEQGTSPYRTDDHDH